MVKQEDYKSQEGYWVFKLVDGVVIKRRATQQEIIQAEKISKEICLNKKR